MYNHKNSIDKILENGYELDFGKLIEKAFENYKKIAVTGGFLFIIITVIAAIAALSTMSMFVEFDDLENMTIESNPIYESTISILIYIFGISLISGLASPITAGLFKIIHLAEKNKPFSIGNAFDYYKTNHFLQLFAAAFILSFIGIGVTTLLEYNGVKIYGTIFSLLLSLFTFLTIPLIVFSNLSGTDAIHYSIQLVIKQPLIILGLLIVSIIFSMVGLIAICIGIFFTLPFYYSMIYMIYDAILPDSTEEEDPINQIQSY
ncbi:hypothetical protein [Flavobacterium orientale]|uniref:Beta-carotene 15,15'-monooxygenase n=1 Tax=Flavobacterium orientale TaxID=1756020 RepID=A0A916XW68_9FLAO|nr:hypothetical protein [Flavobacterium orientale]GGD16481.1 hypothetical protein GCM10011343_04210 [Flavobacterium orientale]